MFRRLAFSAALLLGFAANAHAVVILTLTQEGAKTGTNPEDVQCIIYGNSCPGGAQVIKATNYAQSGSDTSYNLWSYDASPADNVADGDPGSYVSSRPVGADGDYDPYTVGYLTSYFGDVFDVGIDVNTTSAAGETLDVFEVYVGGVLEFAYYGGQQIGLASNNGNGYADWQLSSIDLSSFADNLVVEFHAVWTGASDGPENFFITTGEPRRVPAPGALPLILSGLLLTGIGSYRRRRSS